MNIFTGIKRHPIIAGLLTAVISWTFTLYMLARGLGAIFTKAVIESFNEMPHVIKQPDHQQQIQRLDSITDISIYAVILGALATVGGALLFSFGVVNSVIQFVRNRCRTAQNPSPRLEVDHEYEPLSENPSPPPQDLGNSKYLGFSAFSWCTNNVTEAQDVRSSCCSRLRAYFNI